MQYVHTYSYPGNYVAFANNNSAGNAIVVMASWYAAPGTPTISDTLGNTYTMLPPLTGGGAGNGEQTSILIWYALNIAAGANTVTISGAGIDVGITAVEYSGVATSSAIGITSTLPYFGGMPTTTLTSSSFTPSAGSMLFVAFADETNGQTSIAAGSGYTLIQGDGNHVDIEEDNVNSSAGQQTASITVSFATWSWAMYVVEFLPAGGSSPPPLGTVLWTNAGDGSGFSSIVPAVPSSSGVADIFGLQSDRTVAAITSAGTTAWSADVSQAATIVPDFLGGLVLLMRNSSIVDLNGTTGMPNSTFVPTAPNANLFDVAVHTDGTIFAVQYQYTGDPGSPITSQSTSVLGINPTTGAQIFSVPLQGSSLDYSGFNVATSIIVAGDGYAYLAYDYTDNADPPLSHLMLLRVDSSGNAANLDILDLPNFQNGAELALRANLITNADTGTLISWEQAYIPLPDARPRRAASKPAMRTRALTQPTPLFPTQTYGMAITAGGAVTVISSPAVSGQVTNIAPMLQREDGSFVGTVGVGSQNNPQYNMVAFDPSGNLLWTVANDQPQIATADGGVIGQSGTTYDLNGNPTGQLGTLPTQSWTGMAYTSGSSISQIFLPPVPPDIASFWSQVGGNPSGNNTAATECPCLVGSDTGTSDFSPMIRQKTARSLSADVPVPLQGAKFVILEGDSGINTIECPTNVNHCHDVGARWNAVGATQASSLSNQGFSPVLARISSVQDFNTQLTTNGSITGGVIYIGHGGNSPTATSPWDGALFPGQGAEANTNITRSNIGILSNSMLSPNATIALWTCHGAYGGRYWSIASQMAVQLRRYVFAWSVNMFLSQDPSATQATGMPPANSPLYLLPEGGSAVQCFSPSGYRCPGNPPLPYLPY